MNIIDILKSKNEYVNEFKERIPVVNFDKVGMKDLRSLTSYKVSQVMENNWLPEGLVAWKTAKNGEKITFVYFKGRVAVVTTMANDPEMDVEEFLKQATRLYQLESKKIVHSACA